MILGVNEEDPRAVDTVCNLSTPPSKWGRVNQMMCRPNGDFVVLDRDAGEIAVFDAEWEYREKLVNYGSGKGKIIAPSSFAMMTSGKLVVGDRKNFPIQIFAPDGKFLFYGGWNQPSAQHGWEAAAVAVDSRDFVWVADETNAQFRIFDQSGTLISTLPFYHQAISPVAMTGTIDNRMAVLEQTGTLLFYTLE